MNRKGFAVVAGIMVSLGSVALGQAADAPKGVNTVASLAAAGFTVHSTMVRPSDAKQMLVTLQKEKDVYFCAVYLDKLGVTADACAKAN